MKYPLRNGFLVALEGIDGAGKSTQARLLAETLRARGLDVVLSREPTDGQWGRLLRQSATTGRLSPAEELETFMKDRKEHVENLLLPSLKAGKIVILDRYYFSTVAYQGARGFDPVEILRRNEAFAPEPDLLIIIDADPDMGRTRIKTRGDTSNLFETDNQLAKARVIFNSLLKPYIFRIDGYLTLEEVQQQIREEFDRAAAQRIHESVWLTQQQRQAALHDLLGDDLLPQSTPPAS